MFVLNSCLLIFFLSHFIYLTFLDYIQVSVYHLPREVSDAFQYNARELVVSPLLKVLDPPLVGGRVLQSS